MDREPPGHSRLAGKCLRGAENLVEDSRDVPAVKASRRALVERSELDLCLNAPIEKFHHQRQRHRIGLTDERTALAQSMGLTNRKARVTLVGRPVEIGLDAGRDRIENFDERVEFIDRSSRRLQSPDHAANRVGCSTSRMLLPGHSPQFRLGPLSTPDAERIHPFDERFGDERGVTHSSKSATTGA